MPHTNHCQNRGSTGRGVRRRSPDDDLAQAVLTLVAEDRGIAPRLLLHPSRCRAGVAATRQLAMYLMHVALGRSLSQVGRFFGRDRTTVSYACGRVEDLRDVPAFDDDVARIEARIADLVARRDGLGEVGRAAG